MAEYDFTLNFDISRLTGTPETMLEDLYEAGCDDAIIGIGRSGRIAVNFTRVADSASLAVSSALSDVCKALPQARLIEATPDFVGLSDIADILGFSRQNIRSLYCKYQSTFPSPIHEGSTSIWHLANVLAWFKEKEHCRIESNLLEVSVANMKLNLARQIQEAA